MMMAACIFNLPKQLSTKFRLCPRLVQNENDLSLNDLKTGNNFTTLLFQLMTTLSFSFKNLMYTTVLEAYAAFRNIRLF